MSQHWHSTAQIRGKCSLLGQKHESVSIHSFDDWWKPVIDHVPDWLTYWLTDWPPIVTCRPSSSKGRTGGEGSGGWSKDRRNWTKVLVSHLIVRHICERKTIEKNICDGMNEILHSNYFQDRGVINKEIWKLERERLRYRFIRDKMKSKQISFVRI